MFAAVAVPALIVAALSYLLGSISFSIIFTKKLHHKDIRTMGSGNAGLTNVLRSAGAKAGLLTFIFDFLKGAVSVEAGRLIFEYFCARAGMPAYFAQYGAYLAGLFCMIGHIYPLYFGFRGGKGVLSPAATLAVLDWRFFVLCVGLFVLVVLISRYVSLGSILGAASFPVEEQKIGHREYRSGISPFGPLPLSYVWVTTLLSVTIAALMIVKHRDNIRRLKNGTENKFTIRRGV